MCGLGVEYRGRVASLYAAAILSPILNDLCAQERGQRWLIESSVLNRPKWSRSVVSAGVEGVWEEMASDLDSLFASGKGERYDKEMIWVLRHGVPGSG